MKNQIVQIIDSLRNATKQGARFMSFLYTTKGTGETSIYTINFGIDYDAAVKGDKALIESYTPANALEEQAKGEILQSLTERLENGVSSSYTHSAENKINGEDTYENIGKGLKYHTETGEIYIYGYIHTKTQVAPPTNPKKPVNSKPLTLAKKSVEKNSGTKRDKFKQFVLSAESIAGIKINGEIIEVQGV